MSRRKRQLDRNDRLREPTKKEKKVLTKKALAMLECKVCRREMRLSWEVLKLAGMVCCEREMVVSVACLNKGILPRAI